MDSPAAINVAPASMLAAATTRGRRESQFDSWAAKLASRLKIRAVSTAKMAPYTSIWTGTDPRAGLVNCGMNATTKSPGLGLSTLVSRPVAKTLGSDCLWAGWNEMRLREVMAL
jgi:hypothetical protein